MQQIPDHPDLLSLLHNMPKRTIQFRNPIETYLNVLSRKHYFLFFVIFMCKAPIFWHMISLLFLAPPDDFYCIRSDVNKSNKSITLLNLCPCNKPLWNRSVFTETLQSKYGITCERTWLLGFSHSIMYFGCLLGSILFGFLSDIFGRCSMFSLSVFIVGAFGCLVVVMPTIATCSFIRFLEGIGVGGAIIIGYVLCAEYCGTHHRDLVLTLLHIPLNLGHIALAAISYLLRNCDDFQLAISIPLFLFVGIHWCIMESPTWLVNNDSVDKAAYVIKKLSKYKNVSAVEIKAEIEEYLANQGQTSRKLRFWHVFHHKRPSMNFICLAINYFICGLGFYGVIQYISHIGGDIHANVAFSGVVLLLGTISAVFLIKKLSRKKFLMATNFLSGAFMLTVVLIPTNYVWPRVILAAFSNSFSFMTFIVIFLYAVEVFPTSIRNSALGCLFVISRVGQMAAPFVNQLSQTVSGSIFCGLAILGGVLYFPLPETKNVELLTSFEDSMAWLRRKETNSQEDTK